MSLISGIFGLLSGLIKLFMAWKLIDMGKGQATLEALKKAEAEYELARQARLDQRNANNDPTNVVRPDKFTRPDD